MARRRLVFVPGFLASMIFRPRSDDPNRGDLVWMSYVGIARGDHKYLDPTIPGSEIEGGKLWAGPPLEHYHQGWYDFAVLPDITCSTWGYDFRKATGSNAELLARHLSYLAESADEVDVVGHSMGGLIAARSFELIDRQQQPKFRRFVSLGTPWRGSYATLGYLSGFGESIYAVAALNSYGSADRFQENREYLKKLLALWPGVYDLLPSPALIELEKPGRGNEPWDADTWRSINPNVSQRELTAAKFLLLQGYRLLPGMRHLNIRGIRQATPGPIPPLSSHGYYLSFFNGAGDGVVPFASAASPFTENTRMENVEVDHLYMPNDDKCQRLVRDFLLND